MLNDARLIDIAIQNHPRWSEIDAERGREVDAQVCFDIRLRIAAQKGINDLPDKRAGKFRGFDDLGDVIRQTLKRPEGATDSRTVKQLYDHRWVLQRERKTGRLRLTGQPHLHGHVDPVVGHLVLN